MHGIDGLLLATLLSGMMLMVLGLARLGSYVKLVPYPVVIGFTAGIALIILTSQITALTGMRLQGAEPGPMLEKLPALWAALPSVEFPALAVSIGSVLAILGFRRFLPSWPGMLIVVAAVSFISAVLHLPVETIGSRFGAFPVGLPMPEIPDLSAGRILAVLPSAIAFTLLGAIESLLSAVVADSMTGRRHRANCELVAQGLANIGSALFGGICVTGTIARTATNVRAGARGPLAGMFHAIYLLVFLLFAAPLVSYVPLAALAGVLVVVAWNMVEKHALAALLRSSPADAAVLLATLGLTVFWGLAEAIVVGIALGSLAFMHRMAKSAAVEAHQPFMAGDLADDDPRGRMPVDALPRDEHGIAIYRISGVFFFGAAAAIGAVLERVAERCPALVVDLSAVPLVDSTAAHAIEGLANKVGQRGGSVFVTGASPAVRRLLREHAVKPPLVRFAATPEAALKRLRELPAPP